MSNMTGAAKMVANDKISVAECADIDGDFPFIVMLHATFVDIKTINYTTGEISIRRHLVYIFDEQNPYAGHNRDIILQWSKATVMGDWKIIDCGVAFQLEEDRTLFCLSFK